MILTKIFSLWPRGSSWVVRPPLLVAFDTVKYRLVSSRHSTALTWLEASERVSPFCWACLQVFWRTTDSAPDTSALRWQVWRWRWSYFEFPTPRRHANPDIQKSNAIAIRSNFCKSIYLTLWASENNKRFCLKLCSLYNSVILFS